MYEYIIGKVSELNPAHTVLECGGIGYNILISLNTYTMLEVNKETKLYVHQVVREDAHLLFGFFEKSEREMFRLLNTVSGVGANTARMILSSLNPSELQMAITGSNVNVLKGVKGIGLKTAQRIIVDLKDKISKTSVSDEFFTGKYNTIKDESLSALIMLGFPKNISEKIVDKILAENNQISVEGLIKEALKSM
ncbi:MAG: Holliday junction DNA helicase RuvA [Bacteroidetes bacterium GWA2_30_7]|nr:MAG: Holliday junction DNA helicase RuvA [Bacteroidetes bacterium GWA2_30_7]